MRVAQAAFGALQPLPSLLELLAVTCGMLCLPPSSTPTALGAGVPLLPRACQAARWAPVASRLAAPSAACHTRCCGAGIAKPLRSLPDGPPGWQESSAPCCPLAGCQHPRAGPLPGARWPKAAASWKDARQLGPSGLPGACLASRPGAGRQKLNPVSGSAALWGSCSAAASSRVPLRQGHCCHHSLASLVQCQNPPGWDTAQVPP